MTFNTSIIPDSITNPDVNPTNAKDNVSPLSFLSFITITRVEYSPEEYNNYYISYLKKWAEIKNTTRNSTVTYVDIYVEFLKEIVLIYSTAQERKFLSSLDFTDSADLDIAIPFFADKIRQIVLFYKEKRDKAKFVIARNKIKGTKTSIEKIIFEKIYEFIFTSQDNPAYDKLSDVFDRIKTDLDISIEEYVDVYGNYFDIPPVLNTKINIADVSFNSDVDNSSEDDIEYLYQKYNRNKLEQSKDIIFKDDGVATQNNTFGNLVEYNKIIDIDTTLLQADQNSLLDLNVSDRVAMYSSNINQIDTNLFFEDSKDDIFGSEAFLQDLPLLANISTSYDPVCDPTNPLELIKAEEEAKAGMSEGDKNTLKKKLLSKFLGTDIYYIDTSKAPTGSNEPIDPDLLYDSGILIKADRPWGDIFNQQTANTASIPADFIEDEKKASTLMRNIGLFFKPDKTGLFKLNTNKFEYSIDESKLESNKVYIFPDPRVYGNVSINNQSDYPVVYVYDLKDDVRNTSSGFAYGDPLVHNDEQTISAYYTRDNNNKRNIVNDEGYNFNFTDLFNRGYISKVQYDVFGNEYALFKDEFGYTFRGITEDIRNIILNLLLDGHAFYDRFEGYNFDYGVASVDNTTTRSGLTSHTVDDENQLSMILNGWPYTLYFREFLPYQDLITESRNITGAFRDGGIFTFKDSSLLPESIFGDDVDYPSTESYYYTELADGGLALTYNSFLDTTQYTRPVFNYLLNEEGSNITTELEISITTSNTDADFTLDVKYLLSSVNAEEYDCGYFTDVIELTNDYIYQPQVPYYDIINNDTATIISSLSAKSGYIPHQEREKLAGKLFVKNQAYSLSNSLLSAMPVIFNKYSTSIKQEIANKIVDFDVIYDSIILETDKYLIFEKIRYSDGSYTPPNTQNTYFEYISGSSLSRFSNRFFRESDRRVFFVNLEPSINEKYTSNNKAIIPHIYEYEIDTNRCLKIFPSQNQADEFTLDYSLGDIFDSDYDINIVYIDKPIISYNSVNKIFKITFKGVDNNNLFHIFDYSFYIDNNREVVIDGVKYYKHNKVIRTTTFDTGDTQYGILSTFAGSAEFTNNKLII